MVTFEQVVLKETTLSNARLFQKRFIPIEKIAKEPKKYGYSFDVRESNAKQGEFINAKHKITAAICANRAGKSESGAVKSLRICLGANGGRFWIVTPSYDSQKSGAQEKILEYLKPSDIASRSYATGKALRDITLTNGVIIEFKTFEQGREKLQSAKLIGCWFDEEPPLDIYEEVYTRTIDNSAQIIMTFTPLMGLTWTYERIFNKANDDTLVLTWGMADNPFIPLAEIERMRKDLSPKQAQMRLHGRYMGSETAVFQVFDRSVHINKVPMYNAGMPVDVTVDFGVVVSAALFGQYQKIADPKTKKIHERFVIIDAIEMNDTGYASMMRLIYQRIQQKGYQLGDWYCDPAGRSRQQGTRSGTSLLELIKTEFGVDFSYIKKLSIEESIEVVSSFLMNDQGKPRLFLDGEIVVNKSGATLAQRIENYRRDNETHKPIDDDVVTHLIDCLRYFVMNRVRGKLRGQFNQH
jgi:phage terminase large subunit-like protein